jgi:hypothetical protein
MLARKSLSKKRVMILSGILVAVWVIIGVVIYRNLVPRAAPAPYVNLTMPTASGIVPAEPAGQASVSLGLKILRDPNFTLLRPFGEVPLEVKALGRANPFSQITPK